MSSNIRYVLASRRSSRDRDRNKQIIILSVFDMLGYTLISNSVVHKYCWRFILNWFIACCQANAEICCQRSSILLKIKNLIIYQMCTGRNRFVHAGSIGEIIVQWNHIRDARRWLINDAVRIGWYSVSIIQFFFLEVFLLNNNSMLLTDYLLRS